MTVITTNTLRANGFAFAPRITRWIETTLEAWDKAALRRATIAELEKLSDRELDDIGLTRGDIRSAI